MIVQAECGLVISCCGCTLPLIEYPCGTPRQTARQKTSASGLLLYAFFLITHVSLTSKQGLHGESSG